MFGDKQLKPGRAPVFMARFIRFCTWLATPPNMFSGDESVGLYTGLCVDPRGFSDQLDKLQNSLRPAAHSVPSKPRTQMGGG
jgi:hypothetical protein